MANYNQLKASISAVIKSNNRNEITGQILQNVLNQMVGVIGENYQLAGFATPLTNPGAPDQNVFYVADQGGAYVNFDNIVLDAGLSFLMWKNSQWTSHTVNIVTAEWVEQNYVSIDFFRSLFRAYDVNGDEILPNNPADPITEEQTVVDNIKAMVGFWTEQYISTLGHGTGGGGGGGGGATVLDDLLDVTIINPLAGQGLIYNGTKWVNQSIPSGTDMATVWTALAGATNQQINISHLTDALATYATQSWVNQNFITIAYFDRLFRAYNGNTLVSHNDTTSTIDNIKAMFGFWTDFYFSALGIGGLQSPISLASLNDITLTTPISDGQVLQYNLSTGKWTNATLSLTTTLGGLTDVLLTSPSYGDVLLYDGTRWINIALKTINSQSLIGSGDISVGGGATGNYLPLAGGTMVGDIVMNKCSLILRTDTSWSDVYRAIPFSTRDDIREIQFVKSSFEFNPNTDRLKTGGLTLNNGHLILDSQQPGSSTGSATQLVFGNSGTQHVVISSNTGQVVINPSTSSASGHVVLGTGSNNTSFQGTGKFTIGSTLDQIYKLNVEGDIWTTSNLRADARLYSSSAQIGGNALLNVGSVSANTDYLHLYVSSGTSSHTYDRPLVLQYGYGYVGIGVEQPSYKLHVSGSIYATGTITSLSDIKQKNVEQYDAHLGFDEVANAPIIKFTWKEPKAEDKGLQVGSIAQYWEKVLPEAVKRDKEGTLSMSYGVVALVSAIITARKVVDHERRISELEKENERLRTEIEQLRLN